MMKIKISIIMPVYNMEQFLDVSIPSILNQILRDFEFIIINDGSNDKSLEIIRNYAKKDKRIKIIDNKNNIGLTKSLNKGLKLARGKFIARMDADDISFPERLELQYNFLEKNKEVFLVGGGALNISKEEEKISIFKPITDEEKLKEKLQIRNCLYHSTIMFRNNKKIFYRDNFIYAQDYDLYLRLLSQKKRLTNLPNMLIKYRINPQAISFKKPAKQYLFAKKALEFYFQRQKYGRDDYDTFNPNEILSLNINESIDKNILSTEIECNFKINNFKKSRQLIRKYWNYQGFYNKFIIYYITTFFGKRIINNLRRIIWR